MNENENLKKGLGIHARRVTCIYRTGYYDVFSACSGSMYCL